MAGKDCLQKCWRGQESAFYLTAGDALRFLLRWVQEQLASEPRPLLREPTDAVLHREKLCLQLQQQPFSYSF